MPTTSTKYGGRSIWQGKSFERVDEEGKAVMLHELHIILESPFE